MATSAQQLSHVTVITFNNELSSLIQHIPKHSTLVIGREMNAYTGKEENNKSSFHKSSNRNDEHVAGFVIENRHLYLKTKFQKRKGKQWNYPYPNNSKAQLDS